VLADSRELGPGTALARRVLDEPLVVFRDARGRAVALRDRCVHRNAPLSAGVVVGGRLRCGYHGWLYDGEGRVVEVPSLGPSGCGLARRSARGYTVRERDGYVYVRLSDTHDGEFEPFPMPHSGEPGWRRVRLVNRFASSVTNCAENFVDIPHTAYVHAGIFRSQRNERLQAWIVRTEGSVRVTYRNERRNLGWFAWFLNGSDREITHTDSFFMPNVTCVEYGFGRGRHLVITSQCVPVTADETLVYTDRAFRYGAWSRLATPVVRWLAQRIIDQDVSILGRQMEGIRRYGPEFTNTPADLIHVFIGSIRRELAERRDPRLLPTRSQEVEFWV
jgi:phenylpropionate dioxygenase-like ring-hydroxylating dioxygenase large terminal subunit